MKTRHPRVWESFFVLRPQSGNEHELTDPLKSLRCLAPVLRCMFVWRPNASCCRCWAGAAGLFSFYPDCPGSFAGQCRQIFSQVFTVGSLNRLVTRATLSMYLKAHASAMKLLFLCHAMVWNPSLACESRCSRRVSGALAKCLRP